MSNTVKPFFVLKKMSKEEILGYVKDLEAVQYGGILLALFHVGFFISVKGFDSGQHQMGYCGLWFSSLVVLVLFGQKQYIPTIIYFLLAALAGAAFETVREMAELYVGDRKVIVQEYFSMYGVSFVPVLFFASVQFGAGMLMNAAFHNRNVLIRSILGALVVMSLQFWVESVGIQTGFWKWETHPVPLWHYLFYGLYSLPLQILFFIFFKKEVFKNAIVFLCLQFLFFGFINY